MNKDRRELQDKISAIYQPLRRAWRLSHVLLAQALHHSFVGVRIADVRRLETQAIQG
jgi:hypothetical protein